MMTDRGWKTCNFAAVLYLIRKKQNQCNEELHLLEDTKTPCLFASPSYGNIRCHHKLTKFRANLTFLYFNKDDTLKLSPRKEAGILCCTRDGRSESLFFRTMFALHLLRQMCQKAFSPGDYVYMSFPKDFKTKCLKIKVELFLKKCGTGPWVAR